MEKVFESLPTLETERLLLRKVTRDDVADMYHYGSQEEVARYVTWERHRTQTDTEGFIDFILDQYANGKLAPWGIEHKESGKLIGTIDYVLWQVKHRVGEIGYVLTPDYWGQGLMTEAARAVVDFGFQRMGLVRVQAKCFVQNQASARVMEKVGMSFEGVNRQSMLVKGRHEDLKMYAILREEYLVNSSLAEAN